MNDKIVKAFFILIILLNNPLKADEQITRISDNPSDVQNQLLQALNSQLTNTNKNKTTQNNNLNENKKEDNKSDIRNITSNNTIEKSDNKNNLQKEENLKSIESTGLQIPEVKKMPEVPEMPLIPKIQEVQRTPIINESPKIDISENTEGIITNTQDHLEKLTRDLDSSFGLLQEKPMIEIPKINQEDMINSSKDIKINEVSKIDNSVKMDGNKKVENGSNEREKDTIILNKDLIDQKLKEPEIKSNTEEKKDLIVQNNDKTNKQIPTIEEKINSNIPSQLQDKIKIEEKKEGKSENLSLPNPSKAPILQSPLPSTIIPEIPSNNKSNNQNNPLNSSPNSSQNIKNDKIRDIKLENKEINLIEKNNQETTKKSSFTEKIKNLFGSSKEEPNKEIENDVLNNKKDGKKVNQSKISAQKTVLKTESVTPKVKKYKAKIIKKPIEKDIKLQDTLIDDGYEDKIFEYNKPESNFDQYKIIAEMPSFIENAKDSLGNNHINKIYYYHDYIRTLFKAVDDEDIGAMDRLLKILRNTEVTNTSGDTPLLYAVRHHKIKSIRFLLMRGSDRNYKNKNGESPRRIAVANEDYEILSILHK